MFSPAVKVHIPQHRGLFVGVGGLVLCLLCAFLVTKLRIWDVQPDFYALYPVFFALFANERGRYMPSVVLGFIRDLFSAGPLLTYAIIYGILHRTIAPRRRMMFRDGVFAQLLVAFIAVLFSNLAYHASLVAFGAGVGWSDASIISLKTATVTAPLMPLLVWAMKLAMKRLEIERIAGGDFNL